MSDYPSFCIFCGGTPLSREHIWADWLRAYIRRNLPYYHSGRAILNPDRSLERATKKYSGDPRSRRLKIVCAKCNNGWMSSLQNAAKPILIPLLQGAAATLSHDRQNTLAAWVAMTVICAEYLQPRSVSISVTARRWLYKERTAPADLRIWLGNYKRGDWKPHWIHNSLRISEAEGRYPWTINSEDTPRPNTQTTTYVAGQLFVHAFSCPFPEVLNARKITDVVDSHLLQIWPIRHSFVAWPPTAIIDRQADNLAGYTFDCLDSAGRAFGH